MANREITDKIFNVTIKALANKFGEGYNSFGLENPHPKAIPTGHDDLDSLLTKGAHGLYQGGIVELMGSEGSGKTSVALRTVGNAQKMGMFCCWFDAEAAFTEDLARLNGVNPTKLVLPDLMDTKEMESKDGLSFFNSAQLLEMMYQTVVSNVFSVIVLDSVAGLMPQRVLEKDFDPNTFGIAELARSMSMMLPKIAQACKKTDTVVIFVNQLRDQPGAYRQNPYHTPGGRALNFFAHQRISVERIRGVPGDVVISEEGHDRLIGHYARTSIVKNRKAPPPPRGLAIEIPIYYEEYFPDDAKKCYNLARKLQVITMRNGVLTFKQNNAIIFQLEGESVVLAHIRKEEMEPAIAAACIEAASGEKNQTRKAPINVPVTMVELAAKRKSGVPAEVAAKPAKATKRKKSVPALDLN